MVELITSRSETGKLREKVDSYEETIIRWKKRAEVLNKQVTDLETAVRDLKINRDPNQEETSLGKVIMEDSDTADFTLRCETKKFSVHKNILCAR